MTAVGYASTNGDTRKLDKAGGTMTGDLVLADSSPDTDLSAASRGYVDTAVASGGGGGASIRSATARVADGDATLTLTPSATWVIVTSTAGTPLKGSITAAAGDRIVAHAAFMRTFGPHRLDLALLDSNGAIAIYAGSRTSSPLVDGNPVFYPATSFAYIPGAPMFTVGAGHIDGNGKVTVALVHQGTEDTMKVYATPDYPWEMRLENLGGEPA